MQAHDYFWMDTLFNGLCDSNVEFLIEWEKTPKICCEDLGQAHCLATRVFGVDHDVQALLRTRPPFALKLTHHGAPLELPEGTNCAVAFQVSEGENKWYTTGCEYDFNCKHKQKQHIL